MNVADFQKAMQSFLAYLYLILTVQGIHDMKKKIDNSLDSFSAARIGIDGLVCWMFFAGGWKTEFHEARMNC